MAAEITQILEICIFAFFLASLTTFRHKEKCLCNRVCSQAESLESKQGGARPQVVFLFLSSFTLNHLVVFPAFHATSARL